MKSIVLTSLFLFFCQFAFCQDWILVTSDKDGDKWYVKDSYVKKEGFSDLDNQFRIWTKREVKKKTIKKAGRSVIYLNVKELQLIVADCNDRKMKVVTTIIYDSQGKVIYNSTLQEYEQEWIDVVPDSIGEAMLDKICKLFNG